MHDAAIFCESFTLHKPSQDSSKSRRYLLLQLWNPSPFTANGSKILEKIIRFQAYRSNKLFASANTQKILKDSQVSKAPTRLRNTKDSECLVVCEKKSMETAIHRRPIDLVTGKLRLIENFTRWICLQ